MTCSREQETLRPRLARLLAERGLDLAESYPEDLRAELGDRLGTTAGTIAKLLTALRNAQRWDPREQARLDAEVARLRPAALAVTARPSTAPGGEWSKVPERWEDEPAVAAYRAAVTAAQGYMARRDMELRREERTIAREQRRQAKEAARG